MTTKRLAITNTFNTQVLVSGNGQNVMNHYLKAFDKVMSEIVVKDLCSIF